MIKIVIQPWEATYPDPISVVSGTLVSVGRRDEEWGGFLWCRSPSGREGWIPAELLEPDDSGGARVIASYDARELTVGEGDRVNAGDSRAEWTWCEAVDGRAGWVPDRCLADPV